MSRCFRCQTKGVLPILAALLGTQRAKPGGAEGAGVLGRAIIRSLVFQYKGGYHVALYLMGVFALITATLLLGTPCSFQTLLLKTLSSFHPRHSALWQDDGIAFALLQLPCNSQANVVVALPHAS